jgi:hypothetical protein
MSESNENLENLKSSTPPPVNSPFLTLQKAIEFGEYEPERLSIYPEWVQLPRHSQFELIKQGLVNRNRNLIQQFAEISNMLDFSKKPYLQEALDNTQKQIQQLRKDEERLYLEYSQD